MTPLEVYTEYIDGKWSDMNDHLPLLRQLAEGAVLEIGVRTGVSTSALLLGIEEKGGYLWSVDNEDCPAVGLFETISWTLLKADSIKEKEQILKFIPEKLNLLLVDGDHSYEGCLSDLETYGLRAKTICVHDTNAPNFPGVAQAVKEYTEKNRKAVAYYPKSFGMAVIS